MSRDRPDQRAIKPEVVFIFDLIRDVVGGQLRLPRFQRPYVWRREQMIDLLDSVRRHYPIGALLVWETSEPVATLSQVAHVEQPSPPSSSKHLVLDGHQRLSTLVGCLRRPESKDEPTDDEELLRWRVVYNAESEVFEHLDGDKLQPWHFQLNRVMDTLDVLDESDRMRTTSREAQGPAGDDAQVRMWLRRVQDLARSFQSFSLPVIQVRQTDLSDAVDIFARLNTKGQSMSPDQMFSALTYQEGVGSFHLAGELDEVMGRLSRRGFGAVDRRWVLRSVLAILGEDIYHTDWTRIGEDRKGTMRQGLPEAVEATRGALERALDLLESWGVGNHRLLPYSMQLVFLSTALDTLNQTGGNQAGGGPTPPQVQLLRRWFWVSSYTGWFAGANSSEVRKHIDELRRSVQSATLPTQLEQLDFKTPALAFPNAFDMRSARSRTVLNLLLELEPRRADGAPIPDAAGQLLKYGPSAIRRIFSVGTGDKELDSGPANRIFSPAPSSRQQEASWLQQIDPRSDYGEAILTSHAIPLAAFAQLKAGDKEAFLRSRLDELIRLERLRLVREGVTQPLREGTASPPIDVEGPLTYD